MTALQIESWEMQGGTTLIIIYIITGAHSDDSLRYCL